MVRDLTANRTAATWLAVAGAGLILGASLAGQYELTSWPVGQAPPEYRQLISRGDLIVVALDDALLRDLHDAVSAHGALGALASCHLDATFMTQRLARYEGVAAGRTSDRLRNPTNAPPKWADALVRLHAGNRARSVDGFVVDLGDKIGLLRPIAERSSCAPCHGPVGAVSPR